MNHRDLTQQLLDDAHGKANAEVVVIDADGFVHVPLKAYWSVEENHWIIQTRWQSHTEEKQDDRGYPAQ